MNVPMLEPETLADAEALLALARSRHKMIATAESCTGGLIAAALTAIAGSSDVVERGLVTYSNAAKTELLGVPAELIASVGAVSREVAERMASGAISHSRADVAVAVTGVAGPGGGSAEKPVGLVWFAIASRGAPARSVSHIFPGDRTAVRAATVAEAIRLLGAAVTDA
jgi:nicotinamide-nucleotide amidase